MVIIDSEGALLSAQIADDGQWRFPVVENVPTRFEKALLTFEDKRFYAHPGFDPIAIIRAIKLNIMHRRIVSGASTLTMQLARMASNHKKRSLWNKILETQLAVRMEIWHSKCQILKWYASLSPYGGNVVGIEAASWRYFEKQPDQLTWAESATLAVLPNAPSLIHINKNRSRLLKKRNGLLHRLFERGIIDQMELEASLAEPLPSGLYRLPNHASHYLQYRKKQQGIGMVETDIRPDLQESIARILTEAGSGWKENEIHNAAVLILDTRTAQVLAYHGNIPTASDEQMVDMVQARRSSGSILKPLLYAHMIDEGISSPTQLALDIPTYISGFSPSNYNRTYSGAIHSDQALQKSLNIPAVRQLQRFGTDKFLTYLRKHGFSTFDKTGDHYGLSLILGGGEITLWDLAHVYQKMGSILLNDPSKEQLLRRSAIFQTFEALRGLRRPDEEGGWHRMESRVPVAWKTGTSFGHRDAWALGITPEVTIATWVGNADGEGKEDIIGTSTAGHLLFSVLGIMDLNTIWFDPPYEEMDFFNVCNTSGHLAGINCDKTTSTYWPLMTQRTSVCPYHKKIYVNAEGTRRITKECSTIEREVRTYFSLPPQVSFYYKKYHPEYLEIPPPASGCSDYLANESLQFVYPLYQDKIYLPKGLNQNQQELIAQVYHRQEEARLFWYIDKQYLGVTTKFHNMKIRPTPGQHTVTVVDQFGEKAEVQFEILGPDNAG